MNIQAAKDLGALIRDRRRQLGLTQQKLADEVGVSRVWIVALEQGKPSAQMELVLRTLRGLGLTLRVDTGRSTPSSKGIDLGAILQASKKNVKSR
jgi:HTH-type transcriptional regulator/antitoxin HipB